MKKIRTLGIITMVFLVLIIGVLGTMAALGIFGAVFPESETILSPEEAGKKWLVPEGGKTVLIKTEAGKIEILLSDSAAAEKFTGFVKTGALSGAAFETLAEDLFIQTSLFGENFAAEQTEFACVNGAVGFVLDEKTAAPSLFIITNSEISGLSESHMTAKGFEPEKAALYKEFGGVPEYEGKVLVFGSVVSGKDTVQKIASGENSGYTGGYSAAESIKIISAEIMDEPTVDN